MVPHLTSLWNRETVAWGNSGITYSDVFALTYFLELLKSIVVARTTRSGCKVPFYTEEILLERVESVLFPHHIAKLRIRFNTDVNNIK